MFVSHSAHCKAEYCYVERLVKVMWIGRKWLRTGTVGEILCSRCWIYGSWQQKVNYFSNSEFYPKLFRLL